ncbi:VOC family protein [Mycobacterium hubeiense]|uniref:VOC family protein n=1 Tax=Mycobacterium hubeiense TaxID=1867256 RepID=UPI000C7F7697|nr:VOC family protein [Mycobacterium sp. QGD 101]
MTPDWVTAFLDFAPEHYGEGMRIWSSATGYGISPRRCDNGEFATLVPADGDAFLKVQRLDEGADRIHLDLHVAHPRTAADRAIELGATELADRGYVVLRSPGGFTFCFVAHPAATRPRPSTWPSGHSSLVDQVCLDIPGPSYDAECTFWAALTEWETRASAVSTDFRSLARPEGHPLRLLLQRLGDSAGDVGAHFDWATTDRAAETQRHVALGARVLDVQPVWTVLADPCGRRYCLTDRDPETGMLG